MDGSPRGLFKTPSGPVEWQEADSLLPQTPVHSGTFELAGYPVGDARRARQSLYLSHFLSTWGQRAWEFLVGLVMLEIHPSSLLLVSIFGLCDAAAVVIFGPAVGIFVDSVPRLRAACTMYIVQNTAVAVSAASCLALVLKWGSLATSSSSASSEALAVPYHGLAYWILVVISMLAGSISSIGALGATLSVEREWTKTLCSNNSDVLASMNSVMKRIDLTCLIASPIGVGLLMTYRIDAAIVGVLVWNVTAWIPECSLLKRAQRASPVLAAPKPQLLPGSIDSTNDSSMSANGNKNINSSTGNEFLNSESNRSGLATCWANLNIVERIKTQLSGWVAFIHQPAAPAALSLALLYLTVMSFGTLMTAYLKWSGLKEAELSIYRGLGAVSGIGATFVFPAVQKKWGLLPTGAAAIWAQLLCLVFAATPAIILGASGTFSTSSAVVTRLLVIGLILSRFGLWGFDLVVNQIIQETVPSGNLGAVNGVQGSLQSLFQMLAYVAGVVIWRPTSFFLLMAGSVGAVATAAVLFTLYAVRVRFNHLGGSVSDTSLPAVLTP